jgi:hypothetical protein
MAVRQPRYSKEEYARRGNEIYELKCVPKSKRGMMVELLRSTSKPERLK